MKFVPNVPRVRGAAPKVPARNRNTINIFKLVLTAQAILNTTNITLQE